MVQLLQLYELNKANFTFEIFLLIHLKGCSVCQVQCQTLSLKQHCGEVTLSVAGVYLFPTQSSLCFFEAACN